jgi:hypothetical protein
VHEEYDRVRSLAARNPDMNEMGRIGSIGQAPVCGRRFGSEYVFTRHESSIGQQGEESRSFLSRKIFAGISSCNALRMCSLQPTQKVVHGTSLSNERSGGWL